VNSLRDVGYPGLVPFMFDGDVNGSVGVGYPKIKVPPFKNIL
jgi:hypothetical protein